MTRVRIFVVLLSLLSLLTTVSGVQVSSVGGVASAWRLVESKAPASATLRFTIALRQRNLDTLNEWLLIASNPLHAHYAQYWSTHEIRALLSLTDAELSAIWSWLHAAGIHHYHVRDWGDALEISTTARQAANLFNTQLSVFEHTETGRRVVRATSGLHAPEHISPLLHMVSGLHSFPQRRARLAAARAAHSTDGPVPSKSVCVVPQTVRLMYNMSSAWGSNSTSQGVLITDNASFNPEDYTTYGRLTDQPVQSVSPSHIVGFNDPPNAQVEGEMDIQMMGGLNLAAVNWFWIEPDTSWLYEMILHVFNTPLVPQVLSLSMGSDETDQCGDESGADTCRANGWNNLTYVNRVNTELQKLALRGLSVLVASGDDGANDMINAFPATSPYVTSVGATELNQARGIKPLSGKDSPLACSMLKVDPPVACVAGGVEQATSLNVSGFLSGGGFSAYLCLPAYQQKAVAAYLSSGVALPPRGDFNASNRAHPDVAAIGSGVLIFDRELSLNGGTSASAPIWAAVLSLLNEVMLEAHGKVIGFANPLLYHMAEQCPMCFHDITVGDNRQPDSDSPLGGLGYECAAGWDPVTGLGTPNVGAMREWIRTGLKLHQQSRRKQ